MDLRANVQGMGTIADVSAYLTNLDPGRRWAELASLSKGCQRTLYLKAEASEPLSLDWFVSDDVPPHTGVRYRGKNSLPLFRDFEKPMARTADGRVYGYNEGVLRKVLGPGYFVLRETRGDEVSRGAVVVDYFQVPDLAPDAVAPGFPPVKPNWRGLQVLVYHKTRDYLRLVAPGVVIGSAWKTMFGTERSLDSYFLLMRQGD
ncbi:MAG: hypothetical protein R3F61_08200 [Myxococcota bacterium]